MISDSIFTIHKFQINVDKLNEPIYLIPFGDMHRFAPLCDTEKWLDFLNWAKKKPNTFYLGMGDFCDFLSFNERKALIQAALHESSYQTIEDLMVEQTNDLVEEITFMKDRIIGLIEGNHYGILQSGITTTQMMCEKLNTKYLGVSSFIRLSFIYGHKSTSIDIWAHHGKGASRLLGGSLNTVEQMSAISDAQINLMGHDHKKSVAFKTNLYLSSGKNGLKLNQRKILIARTGSFLKGYVDNAPSYIARGAMNPTDLGVLKIELTPKRNRKNNSDDFYIDLHCSI
jgi:hypothetical protein